VVEHFTVNLNVAVSPVIIIAARGWSGVDTESADYGKCHDDNGGGEQENLDLFRH
jgi:hypothetical protein